MWRALPLAFAVALGCGGRSTLDPSEGQDYFAPSHPGQAGSSSHQSPKPGPGSPTPTPDPGNPTPDPGAPTPDPGNPSPDPGAPTPDPGNPTPGPGPGTPTPDPGLNPTPPTDVNCTSDNAQGGMACSQPCLTTCGFYEMGVRSCDCASGVFVSCHCPRPWNYQGRPSAPRCSTPDGRTHWLDNTACNDEWAECIGSDPVSGTNPRGCVCLTDPVNGKLEWTCGSTNKWFLPE